MERDFSFRNILPLMPKDQVDKTLGEISVDLNKQGLIFAKDKAIKTAYAVYGMDMSEQEMRQKQVAQLHNVYSKHLPGLIQEPDTQQRLGLDNARVDLALETLGAQTSVVCVSFDLAGKKLLIVDPNIDKTDVIGLFDPIQMAFSKQFPWLEELFEGFDKQLRDKLKDLAGKDKPHVFILTSRNNPFAIPQGEFAEKYGYQIGTIDDFKAAKGIDVILRTVSAEDIFSDPEKHTDLLQALKSGMPIINPLIGAFAGHKGLTAILIRKKLIPADWFPSMLFVHKGKVVYRSESFVSNEVFDQDLFKIVRDVRKNFVVKLCYGPQGPGGLVAIGASSDYKKHEWNKLLDKVEEEQSNLTWLIEEMQENLQTESYISYAAKITDPIDIRKQELNVIEKIYFIGGKFLAEMIMHPKKLVNGSGYSIPVAFLR